MLHEALVKTVASAEEADPETIAKMAVATSKLADALDLTRERRRVLLGIPAPGRRKDEPAKTYDVQPAEPVDWPMDYDAEGRNEDKMTIRG